ncbi:hypothetical protein SFRURICE_010658 [Spodoptera frugiperda]|nr:hypothetical protein SFRURICE_010658 [Spodoptera frugiperda]
MAAQKEREPYHEASVTEHDRVSPSGAEWLNEVMLQSLLTDDYTILPPICSSTTANYHVVLSLNGLEVPTLSHCILYENNTEGRAAIKQYCCNYMVGRRTVDCCAHIMTIIWFLSWARYQENINPPAQLLDHILITFESD